MKSIKELSSQKCPLCTKPLASEEYDQAISKLENQLQENFDKKNTSQQKSHELELEKINKDLSSKFGNDNAFNQKIDELNQETETLIDEIDKWQT